MLYGIAGLLGALVAGICMVGYLPPYSWVADLQLALFGTNLVTVSFLLTTLVAFAPLGVIAHVLEPRLDPKGELTGRWNRFESFLDSWPGKLAMVGVVLIGLGGYLGLRDLSRGPLQEIDVATLERGDGPDHAYVDLTDAIVVWDGKVTFRDNSSTSSFVPILSAEDRRHASVFAHYRQGIPESAPLRGTLDRDDLPGEIRSAYESAGVITPTHYVLDVGADPVDRATTAAWMAGFGFALALAALVWALVRKSPA